MFLAGDPNPPVVLASLNLKKLNMEDCFIPSWSVVALEVLDGDIVDYQKYTTIFSKLTNQAQRSKVVISFVYAVRTYVRILYQNKLMTDYAVLPRGSLISLDFFK